MHGMDHNGKKYVDVEIFLASLRFIKGQKHIFPNPTQSLELVRI